MPSTANEAGARLLRDMSYWAVQVPREVNWCPLLQGGHVWASLKTCLGMSTEVYRRVTEDNPGMAFIISEGEKSQA